MRLSFTGSSKPPPSPTVSSSSEDFNSSDCAILLVDRLYKPGTYHLTPYGSPQPSPIKEKYKDAFEGYDCNTPGCINCQKHDRSGTSGLMQDLLETYKQVTTVTTGNAALSSLHELSSPTGYTILLIDLDNYITQGHRSDSLKQVGRNPDNLYGLELLSVVVKEIELGVISNVVPVVISRNDSPRLMWSCLDLGAADFLVKPVSAQAIKTLWLNASKNLSQMINSKRSNEIEDDATSFSIDITSVHRESPQVAETFYGAPNRDAWLEKLITDYYVPSYQDIGIYKFLQLDSVSNQERSTILRKQLSSWNFCPYDLSDDDLLRCIMIILEDSLSIEGLKNISISTEMLHRFILCVRASYSDLNPYHNFYHAIDVLQATYYMLKKLGLIGQYKGASSYLTHSPTGHKMPLHKYMRPNDVFALIIASLAHDIGHPGVNNTYMINASNPLALLYNDEAVLENFHAMFLFLLMKKHELAFFPDQRCQEYKDFRKTVIGVILSTDMNAHFKYIRKLSEQTVRSNSQENPNFDVERMVFSSAIIKCADISNSARPYNISVRWANSLMKEFSNQAYLEVSKGYPLIMNPQQSERERTQSQIDFIKKTSLPLFDVVAKCIPEFAEFLQIIHENTAKWERLLEIVNKLDSSTINPDNGKYN